MGSNPAQMRESIKEAPTALHLLTIVDMPGEFLLYFKGKSNSKKTIEKHIQVKLLGRKKIGSRCN